MAWPLVDARPASARSTARLAGIVAFLVGLAALAGCRDSEAPRARPDDLPARGATLFADHCSACHGREALGDGPLVGGLISLPADLTRIAERHGGFDPEAVRRTIDGRAGRPGHGGPEMPRWGEFWAAPPGSTAESAVVANLDALVAYLESIQAAPAPQAPEPLPVQVQMNNLADALTAALPAVFSDLAFGDPELRRALGDAVGLLASDAAVLEAHAEDQSQTFAPIARSLARDAERAQAAYAAGNLRATRFRMAELVENCVACHTRLPSLQSQIDRLVDAVDPSRLPAHEALRLLLATRQFEVARDRYEALLLGDEVSIVDRRGFLLDYLIVSLRVLNDFERPRGVLAALAERDGDDSDRARELRRWAASLDSIEAIGNESAAGGPLEPAHQLLRRGDDLRREGRPGAAVVYDIAASGQLFRLIEGTAASEEELARAYYLLGLAESRIGRPPGRERWDDYLETSIRLAPGTAIAAASFALFEERWLARRQGSALFSLPRDELHRLETLRGLAAGAVGDGGAI